MHITDGLLRHLQDRSLAGRYRQRGGVYGGSGVLEGYGWLTSLAPSRSAVLYGLEISDNFVLDIDSKE